MRNGTALALAALALASAARAQDAPKAGDPPKPADPPAAPAAPVPRRTREFQAAVDKAIDRGVAWLRERQQKDGSFEIRPVQMFMVAGNGSLGPTALALYTLRACGVPAEDPAVANGFRSLRTRYESLRAQRDGLDTYGIALALLALEAHHAAMPPAAARIPEEDVLWVNELARWLVVAQTKDGGFSYGSPARGAATYDFSNGQFALLGLKAAVRCGVRVPKDVWFRAADLLLDTQEKRGPAVGRFAPTGVDDPEYAAGGLRETGKDAARGWGYRSGNPATGSMTAGGVSSLVICRSELLGSPGWGAEADRRMTRGIRDGLAWLGGHFTVAGNPGIPGAMAFHEIWHYYFLYGLERAGVLSGVSHMERHDWYPEGARFLLESQRDDGSWISETALEAGAKPGIGPDAPTANFLDSCFALLFLKRATFRVDRGAVATEDADASLDLGGAAGLGDANFAAVFDAVFARFRAADAAGRDRLAPDFVRLGTRSVPLLLRRLESEDVAERTAGLEALRRTAGETRGFDPGSPAEARAAALAAWEEWWVGARDRLVADLATGRFAVP